jgi:hypothetical protein
LQGGRFAIRECYFSPSFFAALLSDLVLSLSVLELELDRRQPELDRRLSVT